MLILLKKKQESGTIKMPDISLSRPNNEPDQCRPICFFFLKKVNFGKHLAKQCMNNRYLTIFEFQTLYHFTL